MILSVVSRRPLIFRYIGELNFKKIYLTLVSGRNQTQSKNKGSEHFVDGKEAVQ